MTSFQLKKNPDDLNNTRFGNHGFVKQKIARKRWKQSGRSSLVRTRPLWCHHLRRASSRLLSSRSASNVWTPCGSWSKSASLILARSWRWPICRETTGISRDDSMAHLKGPQLLGVFLKVMFKCSGGGGGGWGQKMVLNTCMGKENWFYFAIECHLDYDLPTQQTQLATTRKRKKKWRSISEVSDQALLLKSMPSLAFSFLFSPFFFLDQILSKNSFDVNSKGSWSIWVWGC